MEINNGIIIDGVPTRTLRPNIAELETDDTVPRVGRGTRRMLPANQLEPQDPNARMGPRKYRARSQ